MQIQIPVDVTDIVQKVGQKAWDLTLRAVVVEAWIVVSVGGLALLSGLITAAFWMKYSDEEPEFLAVATLILIPFGLISVGIGVYDLAVPELAAIKMILGRH